MAQIFAPPHDPAKPVFNPGKPYEVYQRAYDVWVAELAERARLAAAKLERGGLADLVGETVSFHVADSYACYMVWSTKPLRLIHLTDGYAIPEAHARGLRIGDIRKMVERERAWRAIVEARRTN